MVSTERIMVRDSRVRMGITPAKRGMPKSCMGTAARSAMTRDSTSSEGSSSPTCRLPIRRMPTIKTRYKITVRTKPVNISFPPGEYCLSSLPKFCARYSVEKSREKDFEKITDASCIV